MVITKPAVLGSEECTRLMAAYEFYKSKSSIKDYSGSPVVYYKPSLESTLAQLLRNAAWLAVEHALHGLEIIEHRLYPETVVLAMLSNGGHHIEHADNAKRMGGQWVPNHTPNRTVSALYYLNQDFDGGEIVFPSIGLTIKPTTGMLIAFPSDEHHTHLVNPVLRGRRYSVAVWMTKHKQFELHMP